MNNNIELSIITPMHNEALCIDEFVSRTYAVLSRSIQNFEIIIVNDGSTDDTEIRVKQLCNQIPELKGVSLSRNSGQCNAIYAGIQHSSGKYIVIMDGDLQHKPEEIPLLFNKIGEGYDLVSGTRQKRKESLILKRIPSLIANFLLRLTTGCPIRDMGGFKCLRGDIARKLHLRPGQHRLFPALVYLRGGRVAEVDVSAPERFAGEGHYGISRSFDVLFDIVMLWFQSSFKSRPIYLFGRLSLLFFLFSLILVILLLYEKFCFGIPIGTRPPFLISMILFLSSMGFMSMGFILEILTDALNSIMNIKHYVVSDTINLSDKNK